MRCAWKRAGYSMFRIGCRIISAKHYPCAVLTCRRPSRAMDAHTHIGEYTNAGGGLFLTLQERLRHIAIIGATGSGKSNFLRHLAWQDVSRGDGLLLLDQHGDLADAVLSDVDPTRHNHVCYFNLGDLSHPIGFNVLEDTPPDERAAAVDAVVSAMHSIWFESWGPRMELILRHACRVLLEAPNGTLLLLPRLLTDDGFRAQLVARVSDPLTRSFFNSRFDKWRDTYRDEAVEPVLNKAGAFLAFDSIRYCLGQSRSSLHLPYAMEHGRVVVVNLASGTVGQTAARLFGALLLGRLRAAAMARAKIPADMRRPFHLLIDEAQAFGPASIVSLLNEVRKYACSITLATQFLDGLTDATRAALLGNAGTLAVFRCAPQDAEVLAPNFDRAHQSFNAYALQELTSARQWCGRSNMMQRA